MAFLAGAAVFFLTYSFLQEVLIQRRSFDLVIKVRTTSPLTLTGCYNALPDEKKVKSFRFELTKEGPHDLHFPYPADEELHRIFLFSEPREAEFHISALFLDGGYVDYTAKQLQLPGGIHIAGDLTKGEELVRSAGESGIRVSLTRKFPVLVIDRPIIHDLNDHLLYWPRTIGWIAASLVFLLIPFALRSGSRLLDYTAYDLAFCGLFLLLLFIPFISQKDNDSQENRTLAPFPELNQLIWKIPGAYTDYFNDHFPYRNELGRLNNLLKVGVFGVSPMPDHVRIGKDGWLFDNFVNIREIYMGDSLFSKEELNKIGFNLMEKRNWLALHNIDFYFIMPPLKHEIYPEFLPAVMKKRSDLNKRTQLINHLKNNTDIKLVDAYEVLREKKDSAQLYYKTDTHWNRLGAFFVYRRLMEKIRLNHPDLSILHMEDYELKRQRLYNGDLLALMNIDTFFYREPYIFIPRYDIHAVEFRNQGFVLPERKEYQYYTNSSAPAIRLLVFRDSFCSYLIEHLCESFSYAGFSWSSVIIPERIAEAQPDIVVQEMMEMFMNDLLTDNPEIMKKELSEASATR